MSNAFFHISNPGLLTPETPEIATLKFSRTNPRRPLRPCDRGPKGLATVARRPCDCGPALAQRTTIIPVRMTLRNTRASTPRENRLNRPNLGSDFRWCWWFIPYSLPECFGRS